MPRLINLFLVRPLSLQRLEKPLSATLTGCSPHSDPPRPSIRIQRAFILSRATTIYIGLLGLGVVPIAQATLCSHSMFTSWSPDFVVAIHLLSCTIPKCSKTGLLVSNVSLKRLALAFDWVAVIRLKHKTASVFQHSGHSIYHK